MTENEQYEPESKVLRAEPGVFKLTGYPADLLVAANLAERWFADMVRETKSDTGGATDSIRREVVFAACFAESYIFEWTRKLTGKDVGDYFELEYPFECLKQRWKRVPVDLYEAGVVVAPCRPNIDWAEMGEVTQYRNGLVHGAASIPRGLKSEVGDPPEPVPKLSDLERRGQGWALKAVLKVVEQLHQQTGTPVPDYLQGHLSQEASPEP